MNEQRKIEKFGVGNFYPDSHPPEFSFFKKKCIDVALGYDDGFTFTPKFGEFKKTEDIFDYLRQYLENKELVWDDYQPLTQFMFHSAKSSLDKIGKIHAIERTLYSEYLGLAGRVDCIAEYEGELAVIDFKTSKKIKPEKWIEQYFVQEVAYACMYYELTGIPIQKLITIMVTPNGEIKVYDKRNKGDYIKLLVKYVKEFIKNRMVANGQH